MIKMKSEEAEHSFIFSFVQITDTHCLEKYKKLPYSLARTFFRFGRSSFHWRDSANSFSILQNTIEYINQKIKPNFLIHTGDLTEQGKLSDLKTTRELLAKLICPHYSLMGDNDGEAHSHSNFNRSNYLKVFGQRRYSFDCQGWHIVILSVYPDDAELNWLRRDLSENAARPIIFATHHLIVGNFALWFVEKCLRIKLFMPRAGEVLKILKNCPNVKLVLSGHCHSNFRREKDGVNFVSTAALVEVPHRFTLFRIYQNKITMTLFTAHTAKDVFNRRLFSF